MPKLVSEEAEKAPQQAVEEASKQVLRGLAEQTAREQGLKPHVLEQINRATAAARTLVEHSHEIDRKFGRSPKRQIAEIGDLRKKVARMGELEIVKRNKQLQEALGGIERTLATAMRYHNKGDNERAGRLYDQANAQTLSIALISAGAPREIAMATQSAAELYQKGEKKRADMIMQGAQLYLEHQDFLSRPGGERALGSLAYFMVAMASPEVNAPVPLSPEAYADHVERTGMEPQMGEPNVPELLRQGRERLGELGQEIEADKERREEDIHASISLGTGRLRGLADDAHPSLAPSVERVISDAEKVMQRIESGEKVSEQELGRLSIRILEAEEACRATGRTARKDVAETRAAGLDLLAEGGSKKQYDMVITAASELEGSRSAALSKAVTAHVAAIREKEGKERAAEIAKLGATVAQHVQSDVEAAAKATKGPAGEALAKIAEGLAEGADVEAIRRARSAIQIAEQMRKAMRGKDAETKAGLETIYTRGIEAMGRGQEDAAMAQSMLAERYAGKHAAHEEIEQVSERISTSKDDQELQQNTVLAQQYVAVDGRAEKVRDALGKVRSNDPLSAPLQELAGSLEGFRKQIAGGEQLTAVEELQQHMDTADRMAGAATSVWGGRRKDMASFLSMAVTAAKQGRTEDAARYAASSETYMKLGSNEDRQAVLHAAEQHSKGEMDTGKFNMTLTVYETLAETEAGLNYQQKQEARKNFRLAGQYAQGENSSEAKLVLDAAVAHARWSAISESSLDAEGKEKRKSALEFAEKHLKIAATVPEGQTLTEQHGKDEKGVEQVEDLGYQASAYISEAEAAGSSIKLDSSLGARTKRSFERKKKREEARAAALGKRKGKENSAKFHQQQADQISYESLEGAVAQAKKAYAESARLEQEAAKLAREASRTDSKEKRDKLMQRARQAGVESLRLRQLAEGLAQAVSGTKKCVADTYTRHWYSGLTEFTVGTRILVATAEGHETDVAGNVRKDRNGDPVELAGRKRDAQVQAASAVVAAGQRGLAEQQAIQRRMNSMAYAARKEVFEKNLEYGRELTTTAINSLSDPLVRAEYMSRLQRAGNNADEIHKVYTEVLAKLDREDKQTRTGYNIRTHDRNYRKLVSAIYSEDFAYAGRLMGKTKATMRQDYAFATVSFTAARLRTRNKRMTGGPNTDYPLAAAKRKRTSKGGVELTEDTSQLFLAVIDCIPSGLLPPEERDKYRERYEAGESPLLLMEEMRHQTHGFQWQGRDLSEVVAQGGLVHYEAGEYNSDLKRVQELIDAGDYAGAQKIIGSVLERQAKGAVIEGKRGDALYHRYSAWTEYQKKKTARQETLIAEPEGAKSGAEKEYARKVRETNGHLEPTARDAEQSHEEGRVDHTQAAEAAANVVHLLDEGGEVLDFDMTVAYELYDRLPESRRNAKLRNGSTYSEMMERAAQTTDENDRRKILTEIHVSLQENRSDYSRKDGSATTESDLAFALAAVGAEGKEATALTDDEFIQLGQEARSERTNRMDAQRQAARRFGEKLAARGRSLLMASISEQDEQKKADLVKSAEDMLYFAGGAYRNGSRFVDGDLVPNYIAQVQRADQTIAETRERFVSGDPKAARQEFAQIARMSSEAEAIALGYRPKTVTEIVDGQPVERTVPGYERMEELSPAAYQGLAMIMRQIGHVESEMDRALEQQQGTGGQVQLQYIQTARERISHFHAAMTAVRAAYTTDDPAVAESSMQKAQREMAAGVPFMESETGIYDPHFGMRKAEIAMRSSRETKEAVVMTAETVGIGLAFASGQFWAVAGASAFLGGRKGYETYHYYKSVGGWSQANWEERTRIGVGAMMTVAMVAAPMLGRAAAKAPRGPGPAAPRSMPAQLMQQARRAMPAIAQRGAQISGYAVIGGGLYDAVNASIEMQSAVESGQTSGAFALFSLAQTWAMASMPGMHALNGLKVRRSGMPIYRSRGRQIVEAVTFGHEFERTTMEQRVEMLTEHTVSREVARMNPQSREAYGKYVAVQERASGRRMSADERLGVITSYETAHASDRSLTFEGFVTERVTAQSVAAETGSRAVAEAGAKIRPLKQRPTAELRSLAGAYRKAMDRAAKEGRRTDSFKWRQDAVRAETEVARRERAAKAEAAKPAEAPVAAEEKGKGVEVEVPPPAAAPDETVAEEKGKGVEVEIPPPVAAPQEAGPRAEERAAGTEAAVPRLRPVAERTPAELREAARERRAAAKKETNEKVKKRLLSEARTLDRRAMERETEMAQEAEAQPMKKAVGAEGVTHVGPEREGMIAGEERGGAERPRAGPEEKPGKVIRFPGAPETRAGERAEAPAPRGEIGPRQRAEAPAEKVSMDAAMEGRMAALGERMETTAQERDRVVAEGRRTGRTDEAAAEANVLGERLDRMQGAEPRAARLREAYEAFARAKAEGRTANPDEVAASSGITRDEALFTSRLADRAHEMPPERVAEEIVAVAVDPELAHYDTVQGRLNENAQGCVQGEPSRFVEGYMTFLEKVFGTRENIPRALIPEEGRTLFDTVSWATKALEGTLAEVRKKVGYSPDIFAAYERFYSQFRTGAGLLGRFADNIRSGKGKRRVGVIAFDGAATWKKNGYARELGDLGLIIYFEATRRFQERNPEVLTTAQTAQGDEVVVVIPGEKLGLRPKRTIERYRKQFESTLAEVAAEMGIGKESPIYDAMVGVGAHGGVVEVLPKEGGYTFRVRGEKGEGEATLDGALTRVEVSAAFERLAKEKGGKEVVAAIDGFITTVMNTETVGRPLEPLSRINSERGEAGLPPLEMDAYATFRIGFEPVKFRRFMERFSESNGKGLTHVQSDLAGPSVINGLGHPLTDKLTAHFADSIAARLQEAGLGDAVEMYGDGPMSFGFKFKRELSASEKEAFGRALEGAREEFVAKMGEMGVRHIRSAEVSHAFVEHGAKLRKERNPYTKKYETPTEAERPRIEQNIARERAKIGIVSRMFDYTPTKRDSDPGMARFISDLVTSEGANVRTLFTDSTGRPLISEELMGVLERTHTKKWVRTPEDLLNHMLSEKPPNRTPEEWRAEVDKAMRVLGYERGVAREEVAGTRYESQRKAFMEKPFDPQKAAEEITPYLIPGAPSGEGGGNQLLRLREQPPEVQQEVRERGYEIARAREKDISREEFNRRFDTIMDSIVGRGFVPVGEVSRTFLVDPMGRYTPLTPAERESLDRSNMLRPKVAAKAAVEGRTPKGRPVSLRAHGMRTNGLPGFLNMVLGGDLRAKFLGDMEPIGEYGRELHAGDPRRLNPATHGPPWVILRRGAKPGHIGEQDHVAYIVRDRYQQRQVAGALSEAVEKGMMTREEAVGVLSRTFTQQEFLDAPSGSFARPNSEFIRSRRGDGEAHLERATRARGIAEKPTAAEKRATAAIAAEPEFERATPYLLAMEHLARQEGPAAKPRKAAGEIPLEAGRAEPKTAARKAAGAEGREAAPAGKPAEAPRESATGPEEVAGAVIKPRTAVGEIPLEAERGEPAAARKEAVQTNMQKLERALSGEKVEGVTPEHVERARKLAEEIGRDKAMLQVAEEMTDEGPRGPEGGGPGGGAKGRAATAEAAAEQKPGEVTETTAGEKGGGWRGLATKEGLIEFARRAVESPPEERAALLEGLPPEVRSAVEPLTRDEHPFAQAARRSPEALARYTERFGAREIRRIHEEVAGFTREMPAEPAEAIPLTRVKPEPAIPLTRVKPEFRSGTVTAENVTAAIRTGKRPVVLDEAANNLGVDLNEVGARDLELGLVPRQLADEVNYLRSGDELAARTENETAAVQDTARIIHRSRHGKSVDLNDAQRIPEGAGERLAELEGSGMPTNEAIVQVAREIEAGTIRAPEKQAPRESATGPEEVAGAVIKPRTAVGEIPLEAERGAPAEARAAPAEGGPAFKKPVVEAADIEAAIISGEIPEVLRRVLSRKEYSIDPSKIDPRNLKAGKEKPLRDLLEEGSLVRDVNYELSRERLQPHLEGQPENVRETAELLNKAMNNVVEGASDEAAAIGKLPPDTFDRIMKRMQDGASVEEAVAAVAREVAPEQSAGARFERPAGKAAAGGQRPYRARETRRRATPGVERGEPAEGRKLGGAPWERKRGQAPFGAGERRGAAPAAKPKTAAGKIPLEAERGEPTTAGRMAAGAEGMETVPAGKTAESEQRETDPRYAATEHVRSKMGELKEAGMDDREINAVFMDAATAARYYEQYVAQKASRSEEWLRSMYGPSYELYARLSEEGVTGGEAGRRIADEMIGRSLSRRARGTAEELGQKAFERIGERSGEFSKKGLEGEDIGRLERMAEDAGKLYADYLSRGSNDPHFFDDITAEGLHELFPRLKEEGVGAEEAGARIADAIADWYIANKPAAGREKITTPPEVRASARVEERRAELKGKDLTAGKINKIQREARDAAEAYPRYLDEINRDPAHLEGKYGKLHELFARLSEEGVKPGEAGPRIADEMIERNLAERPSKAEQREKNPEYAAAEHVEGRKAELRKAGLDENEIRIIHMDATTTARYYEQYLAQEGSKSQEWLRSMYGKNYELYAKLSEEGVTGGEAGRRIADEMIRWNLSRRAPKPAERAAEAKPAPKAAQRAPEPTERTIDTVPTAKPAAKPKAPPKRAAGKASEAGQQPYLAREGRRGAAPGPERGERTEGEKLGGAPWERKGGQTPYGRGARRTAAKPVEAVRETEATAAIMDYVRDRDNLTSEKKAYDRYTGEEAKRGPADPDGMYDNNASFAGVLHDLNEGFRITDYKQFVRMLELGEYWSGFERGKPGEMGTSHADRARFALNLRSPEAARRFMELLVGEVRRGDMPILLKTANDPQLYGVRLDNTILYARKEHVTAVMEILLKINAQHPELFNDAAPGLMRKIGRGIGAAEESVAKRPKGEGTLLSGELSFGQHRSRAIFSALEKARAAGITDEPAILELIHAEFRAEGINPEKPYLNAGSEDMFVVPEMVTGKINMLSRRPVRANKKTDPVSGQDYIYLRRGKTKGKKKIKIDGEAYSIVDKAEGGMRVIVDGNSVVMPKELREGRAPGREAAVARETDVGEQVAGARVEKPAKKAAGKAAEAGQRPYARRGERRAAPGPERGERAEGEKIGGAPWKRKGGQAPYGVGERGGPGPAERATAPTERAAGASMWGPGLDAYSRVAERGNELMGKGLSRQAVERIQRQAADVAEIYPEYLAETNRDPAYLEAAYGEGLYGIFSKLSEEGVKPEEAGPRIADEMMDWTLAARRSMGSSPTERAVSHGEWGAGLDAYSRVAERGNELMGKGLSRERVRKIQDDAARAAEVYYPEYLAEASKGPEYLEGKYGELHELLGRLREEGVKADEAGPRIADEMIEWNLARVAAPAERAGKPAHGSESAERVISGMMSGASAGRSKALGEFVSLSGEQRVEIIGSMRRMEGQDEAVMMLREADAIAGETGDRIQEIYGVPKEELIEIYGNAENIREAREKVYERLGINVSEPAQTIEGIATEYANLSGKDAEQCKAEVLKLYEEHGAYARKLLARMLRMTDEKFNTTFGQEGMRAGDDHSLGSLLTDREGIISTMAEDFPDGRVTAILAMDGVGRSYMAKIRTADGGHEAVYIKKNDQTAARNGSEISSMSGVPAAPVRTTTRSGRELKYETPEGITSGWGYTTKFGDFDGQVVIDGNGTTVQMSAVAESSVSEMRGNPLLAEFYEKHKGTFFEELGFAFAASYATGSWDRHSDNIRVIILRVNDPSPANIKLLKERGYHVFRDEKTGEHRVFKVGNIDTDVSANYRVNYDPSSHGFDFTQANSKYGTNDLFSIFYDVGVGRGRKVSRKVYDLRRFAFGGKTARVRKVGGPMRQGIERWYKLFGSNENYQSRMRTYLDEHSGEPTGVGRILSEGNRRAINEGGPFKMNGTLNGDEYQFVDMNWRAEMRSEYEITDISMISDSDARYDIPDAIPEGRNCYAISGESAAQLNIPVGDLGSFMAPNGKQVYVATEEQISGADTAIVGRMRGERTLVRVRVDKGIPRGLQEEVPTHIRADSGFGEMTGIEMDRIGAKPVFDTIVEGGSEFMVKQFEGIRKALGDQLRMTQEMQR